MTNWKFNIKLPAGSFKVFGVVVKKCLCFGSKHIGKCHHPDVFNLYFFNECHTALFALALARLFTAAAAAAAVDTAVVAAADVFLLFRLAAQVFCEPDRGQREWL